MNKYRYLIKNVSLLTISSFGTKLLSFFLVPLYTSILTTTEYGIYDLFITTISLLIPILTINIYDGVLRFCLNNTEEKRAEVFTNGFQTVLLSCFVIILFVFINNKFSIISTITEYPYYFIMLYASTAMYQLTTYFARGIEKVKEVSFAGVLSALIGLALNILLLIYAHMGLEGYFIAAISSAVLPTIYLLFRLRVYEYFVCKRVNPLVRHEVFLYSAPLVLNAIGWWVNSASDRYIVTAICGVAANGIYSVGYKIPSILNVFQSIFNQAWVLSSVREYDPADVDSFFAKTYNMYNAILVIVCALIIGFNKFIAHFLYLNEFFTAWQYVPYLTIAIIFGALSGYLGGIFSAAKDSKVFSISTLVGAAVNIVLNIVLVFFTGPMGAAIATTVSYFTVWIIRLINVKKHMRLRLKLIRDCIAYLGLICMAILVHYAEDNDLKYSGILIIFIIIILLFRTEISVFTINFKSLFKINY